MATIPKAKTIPPMNEVVLQWLGRGAGGAGGATVVFGADVVDLKFGQNVTIRNSNKANYLLTVEQ